MLPGVINNLLFLSSLSLSLSLPSFLIGVLALFRLSLFNELVESGMLFSKGLLLGLLCFSSGSDEEASGQIKKYQILRR